MSERKIWWNGEILPESEARISIYSSALMFGDMVFEMTRSFNKIHFKLREHFERLFRSAKSFHIDIPYTIDELEQACYTISELNDSEFQIDDEHRLMINIDRGLLSTYESMGKLGTNVIISDFPLRFTVRGMGKLFDEGINAVTTRQQHVPSYYIDPKVKCRSRAHLMQANWEASQISGNNNWPILLSGSKICEFTGSNFFIVKNGKVLTPESQNILRGISRDYVLKLCEDILKVETSQEDVEIYDVLESNEAFTSATPFCVLPVTSINGQQIGDGKMGRITKSLLDSWSDRVSVDICSQIQNWDQNIIENNGVSPYSFKK